MPEEFQIAFNELDKFLEKETVSVVEPLRKEAQKKLNDVKSKLDDLLDSSEKLLDDANKEIAKGSRKTYRRANALYKLADSFSGSIKKITMPDSINGQILTDTSEQIGRTLKNIDQEKAKWFRAISPYFIISRRRFEASFKRAEDLFKEFTDFLSDDYSKAKKAENIFSEIEKLRQYLAELKRYDRNKQSRERKKELLELRIIKSKNRLQALENKDEVIELSNLEYRIDGLSRNVKYELRHIQKPFLKFKSLVNSPGYSLIPEETSKLEEYMADPFEAFATEKEGYPILRSILKKIELAIDNKKMKLKSSRLRKAQDQIHRIVDRDALLQLQKDCIEIFKKKCALSSSSTINECKTEREMFLDRLKELELKKSGLEIRDAQFEKEHNETLERVDNQKRLLENVISEITNKDVQILID